VSQPTAFISEYVTIITEAKIHNDDLA